MSESMPKAWIRDYFVDVAETYGAHLHNAPVSNKKKKVQLVDLLTYQENSYVWAWISDKNHRVSVRITKDAVEKYKSTYGRSIINSRFFLIFVSSYRPMLSPRPLGPHVSGNTPTSHISLEIDCVSSVGVGGHLFGDPRELELDENIKEWVLGLRQDGGGGNVLKIRKQQRPVQNEETVPSLPPLIERVSNNQPAKAVKDTVKPKVERTQDFMRAYAKRWRIIDRIDRMKLKQKLAEKEAMQTGPPIEPLLGTESRLESRLHEPPVCPTTPPRTPSPTRSQCPATPTDWSLSNRGSPVALKAASASILDNGMRENDEPRSLPAVSHPPSDTDRHGTVDTVVTSDTHSLQPPTPAQRTKRSRHSSSPAETYARFTPRPSPSQQLPGSSPPLLSSSLPPLSSSLSIPVGIRKNLLRKVPHPGVHAAPEPTKRGPGQILVPNSDVSGTGSSQSQPHIPQLSQSQQHQSQLLLHSPQFPSFQSRPPGPSTPREENQVTPSRRSSRARSSPVLRNGDEQNIISVDDSYVNGQADVDLGKQHERSNVRSASNVPEMKVFQGKPDDQETEELQAVDFENQAGSQDTGEGGANVSHGDQLSADDVETHSLVRDTAVGQSPHLAASSDMPCPSVNADEIAVRSDERCGSQSSMHSLFSASLAVEREASFQATVSQAEDKMKDMPDPCYITEHDAEAWRAPSFMTRNKKKGKGKAPAVEEPVIPSSGGRKRRQRSTDPKSPEHKRARKVASEVHQTVLGSITGHTEPQDTEASAIPNIHESDRGSTSHTDAIETIAELRSKSRLANFAVDFERLHLGKGVPMPRLNLDYDMTRILRRTGRIRTLGEKVESDGSVYILR